jgi:hypothetical protein
MRFRRPYDPFLGTLLVLAVGCGSPADTLSLANDTTSPPPPVLSATATGRLELLIENVGSTVSKFRLTGFDQAGRTVFGPSEVDPAAKLEISVPLTMTSLQVVLVSANQIVGGLSIPTTVVVNTLTTLPLPAFVILQNSPTAGDIDFDTGPVSSSPGAFFSITRPAIRFLAGGDEVLLDFDLTRPGSVGVERFAPGVYRVREEGRYFLDFALTGVNLDFLLRVDDAGGREMHRAVGSVGSSRSVASFQQLVDLRSGDTIRVFAQQRDPASIGDLEGGEFRAVRIGSPVSPPPPP